MTGSSGEKMRSTLSARMTLVVWSKPINLPCKEERKSKEQRRFAQGGEQRARCVLLATIARPTHDDHSAILCDDEDLLCKGGSDPGADDAGEANAATGQGRGGRRQGLPGVVSTACRAAVGPGPEQIQYSGTLHACDRRQREGSGSGWVRLTVDVRREGAHCTRGTRRRQRRLFVRVVFVDSMTYS